MKSCTHYQNWLKFRLFPSYSGGELILTVEEVVGVVPVDPMLSDSWCSGTRSASMEGNLHGLGSCTSICTSVFGSE